MKPLVDLFPGLRDSVFLLTSPPDSNYNCIAWALQESTDGWWPDSTGYWPVSLNREESIAALSSLFSARGFVECPSGIHEAGFEKIALFTDDDGVPTHVARQLPQGRWTRKIGEREDIEHDLSALEGIEYGSVVKFMQREIQE